MAKHFYAFEMTGKTYKVGGQIVIPSVARAYETKSDRDRAVEARPLSLRAIYAVLTWFGVYDASRPTMTQTGLYLKLRIGAVM